jgi:DNA repair protein RadC
MKSYSATNKEHFVVFHLNARNEIIETELVSMGTLDASLVHPREVFRHAIVNGSAALLLAHNHPSGNASPSSDDISITQRLVRAGELLGIHVLDHVIMAKGTTRYWSAREEGELS